MKRESVASSFLSDYAHVFIQNFSNSTEVIKRCQKYVRELPAVSQNLMNEIKNESSKKKPKNPNTFTLLCVIFLP